ncbi:hypothetical protein, partial [Pelomonas cellulosilytica]
MQVTLQHHFTSNAHAYRLLIIKEHRKLKLSFPSASLLSFCRQQQRSEILICFLLRRQAVLKINFKPLINLAFFVAFNILL